MGVQRLAFMVFQAYLQFKWPGCDIEVTAGLQPVNLPQSGIFYKSPVYSDNMKKYFTEPRGLH